MSANTMTAMPPTDSAQPDPAMEDILASIRRILNEDSVTAAALGTPTQDLGTAETVIALPGPVADPAPAPVEEEPVLELAAFAVAPTPEPDPPAPEAPPPVAEEAPPAIVVAPPVIEPEMVAEPIAAIAAAMFAAEPLGPEPRPVAAAPEPIAPPAPEPAVEHHHEPMALAQEIDVSVANPSPAQVTPLNPNAPSSLVGATAAAATAASVGELIRAVSSERGAVVSRGGPTLEDIVREEMRPMIKDWLDRHLPGMVERLVRAEIERVVSRAMG